MRETKLDGRWCTRDCKRKSLGCLTYTRLSNYSRNESSSARKLKWNFPRERSNFLSLTLTLSGIPIFPRRRDFVKGGKKKRIDRGYRQCDDSRIRKILARSRRLETWSVHTCILHVARVQTFNFIRCFTRLPLIQVVIRLIVFARMRAARSDATVTAMLVNHNDYWKTRFRTFVQAVSCIARLESERLAVPSEFIARLQLLYRCGFPILVDVGDSHRPRERREHSIGYVTAQPQPTSDLSYSRKTAPSRKHEIRVFPASSVERSICHCRALPFSENYDERWSGRQHFDERTWSAAQR